MFTHNELEFKFLGTVITCLVIVGAVTCVIGLPLLIWWAWHHISITIT